MDLPSKTIFSNGSHDIIARGRAEQKRTFQQFPKLLGDYKSMIRILMEVMLLTGHGRSGLLLMFYNLAKPRALVLLPTHLYLHHIMQNVYILIQMVSINIKLVVYQPYFMERETQLPSDFLSLHSTSLIFLTHLHCNANPSKSTLIMKYM